MYGVCTGHSLWDRRNFRYLCHKMLLFNLWIHVNLCRKMGNPTNNQSSYFGLFVETTCRSHLDSPVRKLSSLKIAQLPERIFFRLHLPFAGQAELLNSIQNNSVVLQARSNLTICMIRWICELRKTFFGKIFGLVYELFGGDSLDLDTFQNCCFNF